MSVVSVRARSFILALFIRDDGERFLLGDKGFDFKDSQLHFSANTIENDEVEKQGVDGVMLAGQVRRASVQSFDGYVGDGTTLKEEVEQMRRDFIAFFAKGHHFRVIYIDCNRNAWQRKGGYLVDAPEVKELWQIHPEYHVGLNFEDVNYYEYDENAEGEEILSNIISVPISSDVEGGLVWDEDGAVSEDVTVVYDGDTATASGTSITVSDAVEAPLSDFKLKGETSQNGTPTPDAPVPVQTVTGENVVKINGKNLADIPDFSVAGSGYAIGASNGAVSVDSTTTNRAISLCSGADGGAWLPAYTSSSVIDHHITGNGGSYTISLANVAKTITGTQAFYVSVYTNKRSVANTTLTSSSNFAPSTITLDSDEHIKDIWIWVGSNTTYNVSFNIQLELGSSASSFEPYQGQSYEINLGKNLFDATNLSPSATLIATVSNKTNNGFDINATVSQGSQWSAYVEYTLNLDANTTYTISRTASVVSGSSYSNYGAMRTHIGSTYGTATTASSLTFTTDATGTVGILFYAAYNQAAASGSTVVRISDLQLEKGSQATDFAAYFTPIELCKIGDYQDYIYKSGGKWYVRKETTSFVLDGTKGGFYSSWFYVSFSNLGITNVGGVNLNAFSPDFTAYGYNTFVGDTTLNGMAQSGSNFVIRNIHYSDAAGYKAWLASSLPKVYYPLAAPTDTEITNEALIEQLEAILSQGSTHAGTNNITTVISEGNTQGELEITYYTKYDAKVVGGGYVWEAGGSGGPTIVTNESISAVSPVWTVFGPALNPMLENTTTGEQIQYVGMISEGQTLVVDMGEQTASLDGLNVISNIVGEYLTLAPGSNTLLFSADSDAPASEIGWSEIVG